MNYTLNNFKAMLEEAKQQNDSESIQLWRYAIREKAKGFSSRESIKRALAKTKSVEDNSNSGIKEKGEIIMHETDNVEITITQAVRLPQTHTILEVGDKVLIIPAKK